MNCHDCRQQLQARLDGEAVPADEIAGHLAACPACRDLETAARRLQEIHHSFGANQLRRSGRNRSATDDIEIGNLGLVDDGIELVELLSQVRRKSRGAVELVSFVH